MAGQLAVTARKSIPVENRSGRLFTAAGIGAAVIATSQWAHWMGFADWDLLSLIPGFAQVTGLLPNAYADGSNFDCPNKTLGSEIALMSDEMLKTVGKTLCTKEELIAASLRGSDGMPRHRIAAAFAPQMDAIILPIQHLIAPAALVAPVVPKPVAPRTNALSRPFTLASIAPVHTDSNKDLVDEINLHARKVDTVDPCSGAMATKSSAGCEIEHPPVDGGHSGGGSSGPGSSGSGGSGGSGGGTEVDYEDHSGSGSGSGSGSSHDGSSNSRDGENENSNDGGEHSGEDSHSGGGSGDTGASHGEYTDNGDSHGGGDTHSGDTSHGGSDGSSHESVDAVDHSGGSDGEGHSGSSVAEDGHGSGGSVEAHDTSSDGGSHGSGDGESSHGSGSDGGSSHGSGGYEGAGSHSGGHG